jgi:hypothetical protein
MPDYVIKSSITKVCPSTKIDSSLETPNVNFQNDKPFINSHGFVKSHFKKGASTERNPKRLERPNPGCKLVDWTVKAKNVML